MEKSDAISALSALAQENRLDVFRYLVQQGPQGAPAGAIAEHLDVPPATLSFHLTNLRHAGLVTCHRHGRSIIYAVNFDTMNAVLEYLTENCCQGHPEARAPARSRPRGRAAPGSRRKARASR